MPSPPAGRAQRLTHKFSVAGHEGYITVGLYDDGQPGEIFLTMAKEGSTVSGLMDTLRHADLHRAAVRRAAAGPGQQVQRTPLRALGLHQQPEVPIAKSIVDYIFRWMGSRFLSKDDRDALGILGGEVVSEAPAEATPSLGAFEAADGPADSTAAEAPPAPSSSSDGVGGDRPQALGVAAATSNGNGSNGNGSNGNGSGGQVLASLGAGQRIAFSVSADSPSCMDCGSIMVRNGSCYKCLNCGATSGCS